MFRNSLLIASLVALAAVANTADAAVRKHHDSCQKWEKREVMKDFWLKRQKVETWSCVGGESREHSPPEKLSGGPTIVDKNPNDPTPPSTTSIDTVTAHFE